MRLNVGSSDFCRTFAPQNALGELAERLGNGLQNRVQQFDSATHLLLTFGSHPGFGVAVGGYKRMNELGRYAIWSTSVLLNECCRPVVDLKP